MSNPFDTLNYCVGLICQVLWGWPLILFFLFVGLLSTLMLNFVQFKYFLKSWQLIIAPQEQEKSAEAEMSPLQAFLNALSTSIGNGSLAGIATAVFSGGPGAVFWIFMLGFFSLPIRFCEVYLSNAFKEDKEESALSVGPMVYLKKVPGGFILPTIYAFFALLLSFAGGNAAQSNSMRLSIQSVAKVPTLAVGIAIFLFMAYIFMGGAQRVIKISEKIVPLKVGLFFFSAIVLIAYHWSSLGNAIHIIVTHAFSLNAIKGAIIGKTIQEAMRFGMARAINATEAGLGVAGIFFGSTGSKTPVNDGIMSMATVFISNYLVSFVVGLILVASGVWDSGLTSTALTVAAYETAFGSLGSWMVALLTLIFGAGVLVAYGFVGRECWIYLTKGRYVTLYNVLYTFVALLGAVADVQLVWSSVDIANAGLLFINLYAIVLLLPTIRKGLKAYQL